MDISYPLETVGCAMGIVRGLTELNSIARKVLPEIDDVVIFAVGSAEFFTAFGTKNEEVNSMHEPV